MAINVQNPVRYAVPQWLDQDHPRGEVGHCVNMRQTGNCSACSDVCPTGATTSERNHTWNACIDCNLCASACPARGIRPSADNLGEFLHVVEGRAEEVTFGCEAVQGDAYLQTYCLGSIPWEVVALAALDKVVVMDISHCKRCPEQAGRDLLLLNLRRVAWFLGKKRFASHVVLTLETTHERQQQAGGFSRREALTSVFDSGGTVFNNLTNAQVKKPIHATIFLDALRLRLENPQAHDPHRYGLQQVIFSTSCWGCSLCKNACPVHAITVEHDQEAHQYFMTLDPLLCTGCGVCQQVCKDNGIEAISTFRTAEPLRRLSTLTHPTVCESCGKNFKPNGNTKCLHCRRSEERAARQTPKEAD